MISDIMIKPRLGPDETKKKQNKQSVRVPADKKKRSLLNSPTKDKPSRQREAPGSLIGLPLLGLLGLGLPCPPFLAARACAHVSEEEVHVVVHCFGKGLSLRVVVVQLQDRLERPLHRAEAALA